MLTKPFRSALAFSFISVAAARSAGADGNPILALRMAELEAQLAKTPSIYLALDPSTPRLEIRSRGMTLDAVRPSAITLLDFQPLFGGSQAPKLVAPTIWHVTQGPGDTDREIIAPTSLRPYTEEDEKQDPAQIVAHGGTPEVPEKKKTETQVPTSYRVQLDNGWQLFVVNRSPKSDAFHRYLDAVADGWRRLRGAEPAHPPLITLVLAPADAQRLHHLFRTDTAILVGPGPLVER